MKWTQPLLHAWPLLALLGLNIALGASLSMIVLRSSDATALLATPATTIPPVVPEVIAQDVVLDLSPIQNAPLFHASRQFIAPPDPQAQQAAIPPDYRLIGTMTGPPESAAAFVRHNQTGARQRLKIGEELEGWSVTEITPRSIALRAGEATFELKTGSVAQNDGIPSVHGVASRPSGITITSPAIEGADGRLRGAREGTATPQAERRGQARPN